MNRRLLLLHSEFLVRSSIFLHSPVGVVTVVDRFVQLTACACNVLAFTFKWGAVFKGATQLLRQSRGFANENRLYEHGNRSQ